MTVLKDLFNSRHDVRKNKTIFSFHNSEEAKIQNTNILRRFNFDITAAINAQPNSMLSFGSEFRDPLDLEPLLFHQPNWQALKEILTNGVTFPLLSKGFALPLLKEVFFNIPNASLAPLGCVEHDMINERGE